MWNARRRLACLWLSQTARALADNCLRMFVVLEVAGAGGRAGEAAWYQVTPFFILPFILLAPLNGALSNGLPKRWVLVGSAAFGLAMTALLLALPADGSAPWVWCVGLGLVMTGTAVYSPTRYALLPAVAADARLPLGRVNSWIETGGSAAVVLGLVLGVRLYGSAWAPGVPAAVAVVLALCLVALAAALPAHFPSDVRRSEPPGRAVVGFFHDTARVLRDGPARAHLLALAGFLALMVAGAGAMLAYSGGLSLSGERTRLGGVMALVGAGVAAGSLLAGLQGNLHRSLGFVPWGAAGLLGALAWAALGGGVYGPCLALGVMGGLINVPLRANYQASVPADARGNGMAALNTAYYLLTTLLAALLFGLARGGVLGPAGQLGLLAALAAAGTLLAWRVLYRESLELVAEALLAPCYRVRLHGPGVGKVPARGPLLVIANHACWMDPFLIGKDMPRPVYPMMTSLFYDLPVIRWLMAHVAHAIRVPAGGFRREAPELQEAGAVLDRGETLLIFPEGQLRRREEVLLRHFGQGVWHVLRQRPETPVVVCWIEGNWGSFFSFKDGPPMKNKRMDFWRRIDLVFAEPTVLDPALLADMRATRRSLWRACLELRRHLGLEVPALPEPAGAEADA